MTHMFKVIRVKSLLSFAACVALPLLVGGLAGFFTQNSSAVYGAITKPPLSPPGWVFPIVWTVLYILIGIASYLIVREGLKKDNVKDALLYYLGSLLLSFIWPLVFFRFNHFFYAVWVILLLWLVTGIATAKFYRIRHSAGLLMLPYWLWITFATYLNIAVWLLNR